MGVGNKIPSERCSNVYLMFHTCTVPFGNMGGGTLRQCFLRTNSLAPYCLALERETALVVVVGPMAAIDLTARSGAFAEASICARVQVYTLADTA